MPVRGNTQNLREMLLDLRVPSYLTTMAIPYMLFMPGTTDPDSQPVIEIVRGLQRGLRKLGYKNIIESGVLDPQTAAALDSLLLQPKGAWMQTTWAQLYGEVIDAIKHPDRRAMNLKGGWRWGQTGLHGLGQYMTVHGQYGPLPGEMVGLPPGPLGLGDSASDGGVSLTFGFGVRDKSNVVPIPKTSGATYQAFKNLQRQINRVIVGVTRIGEDGVIGKGTLSGYQKAENVLGLSLPHSESTAALATHAVTVAALLKDHADSMGISSAANKGVAQTQTSATEQAGKEVTRKEASDAIARGKIFGTVKKAIPFVAIAGGAAFLAAKQGKKKGKR